MPRMEVGNAIAPAFQHMVRVLFKPFELKKWLALGFITLLASSGGGGGNYNFGNWGGRDSDVPGRLSDITSWLLHYWPLLALGALVIVVLSLILTWLASVFHMIYIDDITRSSGAIREPFARLKGIGTSYFLWRLAFGLTVLVLLVTLIGLPLVWVFLLARGTGTEAKIAAVVLAVCIGISLIILSIIIDTFARDFVAPAMYVRGVGVIAGWRIVLPILRANVGQVVLYLLLLIALSIGVGLFALLVTVILALIILLPVGGLAFLGYLIGKAAGLTWTIPVIATVATFGLIVGLGFVYLTNCALQPASAFLRAFSLVVLGQADPSLVTVPTGTPPPAPTIQE